LNFSPNIWNQLKNLTADRLIQALEKDGAKRDVRIGAQQVYRYLDGRKVSIHYHPQKTYKPGLLKSLLSDIGWSEEEMRRLKLIK
jgi:predicted RNA binding protein YcfA (HicA-like mRNA interferase family)